MTKKKLEGPLILLTIALFIGGLDYYLAVRVGDAVETFESRARAGECTTRKPCRIDRVDADVCNAFAGPRLFPTFYAWHVADSLEGQVRAPEGCPGRSRYPITYVAPDG